MTLGITRIDSRQADVDASLAAIRDQLSPRGDIVSAAGRQKTMEVFGQPLSPQEVVARICDEVRDQGAAALCAYTEKLDGAALGPADLRVPERELATAHAAASQDFLATVRLIAANIREFQTAILHRESGLERPDGVRLRQSYRALERVGVCVPGGAAAYPSTLLMAAVPAQAAGVEQIAVVAPPTPFGAYNDDLLATCHELGLGEVYRIGGAQGVATLAYGVESIPKVDKIVGPGNLFVALAKKRVYGDVDIDSIAGPSEVVVIADEPQYASFIAADMLAQAEHSPGASFLITWSDEVLESVAEALERQVARLSRADLTVASLEQYGALIRARDIEEACQLSNSLAPEHLELCSSRAHDMLPRIRHAGAVFMGPYTPVAVGDYAAGPSHVLPTGGTARWASGLSANDFLRSYSVIEYPRSCLSAIAPSVMAMAEKEGLTAHRESVAIRLSPGDASTVAKS